MRMIFSVKIFVFYQIRKTGLCELAIYQPENGAQLVGFFRRHSEASVGVLPKDKPAQLIKLFSLRPKLSF